NKLSNPLDNSEINVINNINNIGNIDKTLTKQKLFDIPDDRFQKLKTRGKAYSDVTDVANNTIGDPRSMIYNFAEKFIDNHFNSPVVSNINKNNCDESYIIINKDGIE